LKDDKLLKWTTEGGKLFHIRAVRSVINKTSGQVYNACFKFLFERLLQQCTERIQCISWWFVRVTRL